MDASLTAKPRRQVNIISGLAVALIFVGGLLQGGIPFIITLIGGALAIVGWVYAMLIAARMRQVDWLIVLGVGLVAAIATGAAAYQVSAGVNEGLIAATELGLFILGFVDLAFGTLGGAYVFERGVSAFFGGWGLLSLVIGGTLVGGAIGTSIGAGAQYITDLGFRLYIVAGALGLVAWVVGLVVAYRTKAWGWFALVVLFPALGAFMFGLFGPTRQDVLMAQENARQRKAAGFV